MGVEVSKENRENLEDCGVNADFTCMPVVPKPGAISGLSRLPWSHHKNPTTTPSLEFSPGAHIVSKRLGLKPPCSTAAAHFPAVMWLCCAGGAGPPHTRVTTGGLAGGRPARGAVIVRVDSCQSRPSTSVYQPLPARWRLCPSHTHPHQVVAATRLKNNKSQKALSSFTKTCFDTLRWRVIHMWRHANFEGHSIPLKVTSPLWPNATQYLNLHFERKKGLLLLQVEKTICTIYNVSSDLKKLIFWQIFVTNVLI